MADYIINDPNARVHIYLPLSGYNNVYISAKDIFVDGVIDVSNGLEGGTGGRGGTATNTFDVADAEAIVGVAGADGSGTSGGSGGAGGTTPVAGLGIDGVDGTDASSAPEEIDYTYSAFSPVADLLDEMKRITPTGNSGGGGGGGSAGDTFYSTCRQVLAAGGGGAGGAGSPAGGRIILLATGEIAFGPNSQLISNGQIVGKNGEDGDYIWAEETDSSGTVTTRIIQVQSVGGTLGGAGGSTSTGIGGTSTGGDGGYGALNYKESDEGLPNECEYSIELAELKKGGDGGDGGLSTGGSILIQSGFDPSTNSSFFPSDITLDGTSTTLSGVSSNTYKDDAITLYLTPSSRDAYVFFDQIVAEIDTDVTSWEGSEATSQFASDSIDNLFSTAQGTPIGSVTLLNHVFTATDAASYVDENISVLLSSTEGKVGKAFANNPAIFYAATPTISSVACFSVNNKFQALKNYILYSQTFGFSGFGGDDNISWSQAGPTVTTTTSTTYLTFDYVSPYVSNNHWREVVGRSLNHTISSDGVSVAVTLTKDEPNTIFYGDEVVDPTDFSEITLQSTGDGKLITTSVSSLSSVTTNFINNSALQYDSISEYIGLTAYKFDDVVAADYTQNTNRDIIQHGATTLNIYLSTNEEYQALLNSIINNSSTSNLWQLSSVDQFGTGNPNVPQLVNPQMEYITDNDSYYAVGSSCFLSGDEFLDYSQVFYFAVSTSQLNQPDNTGWAFMSADLSDSAHAAQTLPVISINRSITNIIIELDRLGVPFSLTRNGIGDFNGYTSNVIGIEQPNMSNDWFKFIESYRPTISALTYNGSVSSTVEFKYNPDYYSVNDGIETFDSSNFDGPVYPSSSYTVYPLEPQNSVQYVSAYLLPQSNNIELLYENPIENVSTVLSSDNFSYGYTNYVVRIPLSGDHGAPIEGWLYDASAGDHFYSTSVYDFTPEFRLNGPDKLYVHLSADIEYNGTFALASSVPEVTAGYHTNIIPDLFFSPDITTQAIQLNQRVESPTPSNYDILYNDSATTIQLLCGEGTVYAEFSGVSAYVDTQTSELSVFAPTNFAFRTDVNETGVDFSTTYQGIVTGALSGTYTDTAAGEIQIDIEYPSTVKINNPNLNATIPSVTAETHRIFSADFSDGTVYSPFNDTFNDAYAAGTGYTGYTVLSSIWKSPSTTHDWYSISEVQNWATLTDTAALQEHIGPLSSDYIDDRHRAADVNNVLSKQPELVRGFFSTTDEQYTIQHFVTAIPSGADGVFYDSIPFTLSAENVVEFEDHVIEEFTVTPSVTTKGVYNETSATFSYMFSAHSGVITPYPTQVDYTLTLETYNTNETEVLLTSSLNTNDIPVLPGQEFTHTVLVTSNLTDVSKIKATVDSSFGIMVEEFDDVKYYAPIKYTEFGTDTENVLSFLGHPLLDGTLAGYLSASPIFYQLIQSPTQDVPNLFDYPAVSPRQIQITNGLSSPEPNILEDTVVLDLDYGDGYGTLSLTGLPLSATELTDRTLYYKEKSPSFVPGTLKYFYEGDLTHTQIILPDYGTTQLYAWPSGSNLSELTAYDTNFIYANNEVFYIGGIVSLSGIINWDFPSVVAGFSLQGSETDILCATRVTYDDYTVSSSKTISANIDLDKHLSTDSVYEFTPQLFVYALLSEPEDPLFSTAYQQDYTIGGVPIQKQSYRTVTYIPDTFRANQSNLLFDTTIGAVTVRSTTYPAVTSSSSTYISADMPVDQFDDGYDRVVTTNITFANVASAFADSNFYAISADVNGTITTGVTAATIQFTVNSTGTTIIPYSATDGTNIFTSQIEYYFNPISLIIPTLYFETTLPTSFVGCPASTPLKLIVWDDVNRDDHTVQLYSRGSGSVPYVDRDNRFSPLIPQWKFIDAQTDSIIDNISTINTPVSSGTEVIGTSGYCEFYYVDDTPTTETGLMIVATLSAQQYVSDLDPDYIQDLGLPGFANSKLNAVQLYHVSDLPPETLDITRDGTRTHRPYYWRTTKIPYTVAIGTNISVCGDCNPTLFSFPQTSAIEFPYDIEIDSLTSTLNYINSSFKSIDDDNLPTGGAVRGTLQPIVSGNSVTMYSSATLNTSALYVHNPFVWVSNPENKTLNRILYDDSSILSQYSDCVDEYTSSSILSSDAFVIQVPYVSGDADEILSPDNTAMYLTGFGGIYGIAIDSCYNVWTADAELDAIYKYNTLGELLTTVELPFGSTPAGISVDRSNNVYVTLAESVSTNKYTTLGEYITSLLPDDFEANAEIGENNLYEPAQVEADNNSNVWVSYTNPNSSCIIKYDTNYNQDTKITLLTGIAPVDMLIDKDDRLHVISQFDRNHLGYPERHVNGHYNVYSTTGTLLSSVTGLNNPHYITIDNNSDIWITQGVANVSVLSGDEFVSYRVKNGVLVPGVTGYTEAAAATDYIVDYNNDIEIEGIGATTDGKLWVLQSRENLAYMIDTASHEIIDTATIYPSETIELYNRSTDMDTRFYAVSDSWYRSAQAYGDWTGIRWATKYVYSSSNQTVTLTGRSEQFDVLDSPEEIRLVNDSYNMSNAISNLFLANHLSRVNNPVFHDEYLGNVIGTNESDYSTIGRQMYEKIANFATNHIDIDSCNIEQLYSICESFDVPIDEYITQYPANLDRLMNIVSVHYNTLRGSKDRYNLKFGPSICGTLGGYTTATDNEFTINREFNPLSITDTVSSGQGLVVYDLTTDRYDLIFVSLPDSQTTTTMSDLTGYGLRTPLAENGNFGSYEFYPYIKDNHTSDFVNNLIDWDNSLNTVLFETSAIEDWYGEYGIIEKLIDYDFHKGLGLILSGVE